MSLPVYLPSSLISKAVVFWVIFYSLDHEGETIYKLFGSFGGG